ncbi:head maturation protease, ClpP-related [Paenibacillus crassostreae]|uniref:ATP-dependent Clp protease proteolytic subunit n=1 Tax=Paenibacillus crassostreae TaxID=1763538 RepID=A0A167C528_9BACL|nr:head maturation protease, ClpP-related [Paenibacillus crassostreae]AOZ91636.1 hypothetical protein LPB68_04990 [Paenibacillus crassostreae]OAB72790.1 hypothetical protein PNBC_15260 [Paenibacillus crassostreae]
MAKKIKLNGPVVSGGNSFIYDWLGIETISPKRVISELDKAGGDDVELYINSGGGSVYAAGEIYAALKEYKGKKTSKITGVAASAATFFISASDEVLISPLGTVMVHNASINTSGDKGDHSSSLELLEGIDKSIAKVYQSKTKLSEQEVLDLMNKTTWMSAEKAVQLGFADGILFDDEIEVSNSDPSGMELPQDVLDKLKNELLKNMIKDGGIIDLQSTASIEPINLAQSTNEGNDRSMDLEKLKAEHSDLYNSIMNEGVKQGEEKERGRITALNALANAPGAAEIVANAIKDGKTAGETALEIVKASAERLTDEGKRRLNDSKNSGVTNVEPDEAPENPSAEAVQKAEADAMIEEIKNLRGGRK